MKSIYVKTEYHDRLNLSQFPNAGPYPCVEGMKNKYWGRDALVVRCGRYAYKVDERTYNEAKSLA